MSRVAVALAVALVAGKAAGQDFPEYDWLDRSRDAIETRATRPPKETRARPWPEDFARIRATGNDEPPREPSAEEQALVAAAGRGDADALARLIAAGVNADRRDLRGERALCAAVRLLLDRGAGTAGRCADGLTPLGAAVLRGHRRSAELLLRDGAFPDERNATGNTPLIDAAALGRADLVRMLLDAGANPALYNRLGHSAIVVAADRGHAAVIRALLAGGVAPNSLDRAGKPALFYAVQRRQKEAIRVLVAAGADPGAMAVDLD
jgi:ankyrin repeat protein